MTCKIIHNNERLLDDFLSCCERNQLDFNEYKFLEEDQLKNYLKNKAIRIMNQGDSLSLIALSNSAPIALLNITLEAFDSEIFRLYCYKISDFIVLSNEYSEVEIIVSGLISELENLLLIKSKQFYISISLNNNVNNANLIFNNLLKGGFFYIHTLLTFSSIGGQNHLNYEKNNQQILIRETKRSDAEEVSKLAEKSFKYSRFHLDPFLDNERANILLKTSAENSILHKFVDIMFIAEYEKKIIGYYSAKKRNILEFNKTLGEATISAVDENYRGLGVFSQLNYNLLKWFSNNTDFAEMGTYLINYPVHKAWIKCNLGLIRGVHQLSKLCK